MTNNTFFPSACNWSSTCGAPGINDSPFLQYIASNRGDDGDDEQRDGESDDGDDCNGDDDDEQTEDDDMYCIGRCRVHTNELTKYCYHMTPSQSKMKTSVLVSNSSADPRISLMFSRIFFTGGSIGGTADKQCRCWMSELLYPTLPYRKYTKHSIDKGWETSEY